MKHHVTGIILCVVLLFLGAAGILIPDKEISETERRHLAQLPAIKVESIWNGSYMTKLEQYFLEQFPMRDGFRTAKAVAETTLFGRKDSGGYYQVDDGLYILEKPWNEVAIRKESMAFCQIAQNYFPQARAWYAVIPDKMHLVSGNYPEYPMGTLTDLLEQNLSTVTYIDLSESLELSSYYRTDPHWRQECLVPVAGTLLETMTKEDETAQIPEIGDYQKIEAAGAFYGAYADASALLTSPDTLNYLTNEVIEGLYVYDFEKKQQIPVYDFDKLTAADPYDFYLQGARALLTIENPAQNNGKNLLIFRDSFGSSIAPLLAPSYSKVTLVDLRYANLDYCLTLIDGSEYTDILFLYSGGILNGGLNL